MTDSGKADKKRLRVIFPIEPNTIASPKPE
jgi:hypothetical protein